MQHDNPIDPRDVLKNTKVVLPVDWPNPDVPRTLLETGFFVFCHSPYGYNKAEVVAEYPHDINKKNIFLPGNKEGFLVFWQLAGPPPSIDVANMHRPEQSMAIIRNVLLALGPKCIWHHPL